jgi:hypothetical protein
VRGSVIAVLAAVALLCVACGSRDPYWTASGHATFLDGSSAKISALTVQQAVEAHPRNPIYVMGYLLAPMDDAWRLCERLNEYADCRGASRLKLTGKLMSLTTLEAAAALKNGCCSTGYWSPRRIVMKGRVSGTTLHVLAFR